VILCPMTSGVRDQGRGLDEAYVEKDRLFGRVRCLMTWKDISSSDGTGRCRRRRDSRYRTSLVCRLQMKADTVGMTNDGVYESDLMVQARTDL